MSKASEIEATIRELQDIVSSINDIADRLHVAFSGTRDNTEKIIALEDVRAVLAEKSRAGYTAQVRELLQKYGASKLSVVASKDYASLLKDAEEIGDGK